MKTLLVVLFSTILTLNIDAQNIEHNMKKGYSFAFDVGFGNVIGNEMKEKSFMKNNSIDRAKPMSLSMIHGIRINSKLAFGVGVGADYYKKNLILLPVFLDAKYQFGSSTSFIPYIFGDIGYNTKLRVKNNNVKGGPMLNLGVGGRYMLDKSLGFGFNLGFNLKRLNSQNYGSFLARMQISLN